MNRTQIDLVYFVVCAVRETTPDPDRVRAMDLDAVWEEAGNQKLRAAVACAIELFDAPEAVVGERRAEKWMDAQNKALRRTMLHEKERRALFALCEEKGIRYLPMKGVYIERMYPVLGMREMADNDILFDPAFRNEIKAFFTGRGYTLEKESPLEKNLHVHDVYMKPPVYNFEMHERLFTEDRGTWDAYFADPFRGTEPIPGTKYGYRMTDLTLYLYVLAHAYKHYTDWGTGFRLLADIYVMEQALSFDRKRADAELKTLGLTEFERTAASLASRIFSAPGAIERETFSPTESEMLENLFRSGTYGTSEQRVKNGMERIGVETANLTAWGKARFVLSRVFPSFDYMKHYFPILKKAPVLLPFVHVYRWIRGVTMRQDRITDDFEGMKKL